VYLTPGVTVLPLATCTVAPPSVAVLATTVVVAEVEPMMPIMYNAADSSVRLPLTMSAPVGLSALPGAKVPLRTWVSPTVPVPLKVPPKKISVTNDVAIEPSTCNVPAFRRCYCW
jgi:hypothetical protein